MLALDLRIAAVVLASAALGVWVERLWSLPFSPLWLSILALLVHPVGIRVYAVRSLRWNYTRRGVWVWLKGRKFSTGRRGFVAVLRDPEAVITEQRALAEGVFS